MFRNIIFVCVVLASGTVMAEGLFIHSYNESSKRFAILDELDESAVLYLSESGSQKPIKDAFAYMRIPPIDIETWKKRMRAGGPPVLHTEIASNDAVIAISKESDFNFLWSKTGNDVSLTYRGKPIAFISLNEQYGYSKAASKTSPVVNPWDQKLYDVIFEQSPNK